MEFPSWISADSALARWRVLGPERRTSTGGERRKLWSVEILVGLGCKTER